MADEWNVFRAEFDAFLAGVRDSPDDIEPGIEALIRTARNVPSTNLRQAVQIILERIEPSRRQDFVREVVERLPPTVVVPATAYVYDLARAPQPASPARDRHAQTRALLIVLVWLMAVILPIVQQCLSAEGQLVTDAEVGTLSFALAITVLLKQGKK